MLNGFRPTARFQTAIGVHPQAFQRHYADGFAQQMLHFGFGGHARAVDVVHARTDVVGVFEFTKRGQQIHVGARSFNGNHIRIHAGDGGQDVVELAVTHVGVDLRAVCRACAG